MIQIKKRVIHLQNIEPVANMKILLLILLAVVCQAYMPIAEQSWIKFRKVKHRLMKVLLYTGNQTLFVRWIF